MYEWVCVHVDACICGVSSYMYTCEWRSVINFRCPCFSGTIGTIHLALGDRVSRCPGTTYYNSWVD